MQRKYKKKQTLISDPRHVLRNIFLFTITAQKKGIVKMSPTPNLVYPKQVFEVTTISPPAAPFTVATQVDLVQEVQDASATDDMIEIILFCCLISTLLHCPPRYKPGRGLSRWDKRWNNWWTFCGLDLDIHYNHWKAILLNTNTKKARSVGDGFDWIICLIFEAISDLWVSGVGRADSDDWWDFSYQVGPSSILWCNFCQKRFSLITFGGFVLC